MIWSWRQKNVISEVDRHAHSGKNQSSPPYSASVSYVLPGSWCTCTCAPIQGAVAFRWKFDSGQLLWMNPNQIFAKLEVCQSFTCYIHSAYWSDSLLIPTGETWEPRSVHWVAAPVATAASGRRRSIASAQLSLSQKNKKTRLITGQ